jgi:hypothetical protein
MIFIKLQFLHLTILFEKIHIMSGNQTESTGYVSTFNNVNTLGETLGRQILSESKLSIWSFL